MDEHQSQTRQVAQAHALGLDDDAFWSEPAKAADAARGRLVEVGKRGLHMDAPFTVNTASRSTLPLVVAHLRTVADDHRIDAEAGALVVAVDLESREFRAATALRSPKGSGDDRLPSKTGGSAPQDGGGIVSDIFEVDARARLELPWGEGRHRIYVVVSDQISNGITVTLTGGAAHAGGPEHVAIGPGAENDLDPPAGDGVAMKLASEAVSEPGGSIPLRGAVRQTGSKSAPVHLLATSDKVAGPFKTSFDVSLDPEGAGKFELDLIAHQQLPKRPVAWHYYAFIGEHASAAHSIALKPGKPW